MTITTKGKGCPEGLVGDKYFISLIEHAADGIAIIQDGVFKMVNTALTRMSGHDKKELLGMPFTQLLTPQSQKLTLERYQAKLAGKKVRPVYNIKAITKDGTILDIEINAALTEYEGRVADEIIIRDITERKQAEEKLRENENKYRTIFENVSDVIIRLDNYGKIVDINQRSEDCFGYKPEEVIGKNFAKLGVLSLKDLPKMVKIFVEVVRGKRTPTILEIEAKRKNGSPVLIEVATALIKKDGKIEGTVAIVRDVTERKKAEQALADETTRRRILVDQSRDSIVVLDQNGKVYESNQQFAEMLGYTPEEVRELYVWDWEVLASHEQILGMLKSVDEAGDHFETRHRRKDGTTIDVGISTNGAVVAGQKLIFCVCRDITERKQAEQALQTEKNKLQSLINAMEYGLTIQDKDYNILYQTEPVRRIHGDHPGEKCYRVYEGREKICDGCPVEKAFKDGKSHTSERKEVSPSGKVTFWENTANPIRDAQGNIVSCLEITRDITDRKQAGEALQQSEKKYKNLAEATSDMIWEADEKGTFTFVSPRIKDILGYEANEVTGKIRTLDLTTKAEAQKWLKRFKEINAKQEPFFGFEITHLHKNGTPVLFETSGIPTFDNAGNFKGYIGVNKDITERKQAEKKLQTILKTALDGFYLADLEGKKLEVNDSYCKMLGYTREELLKMSTQDIEAIESPEETIKHIKNIMAQGYERFESRHKRKDGKIIDVEISVNYLDVGEGQLFVFARDITDRKQAEEALRDSEEKTRKMFESVSCGISVIDLNGVITEVNRRTVEMHGFSSKNELLGKSALDIVAPRDREKIAKNMRQALKRGTIRGQEYTMLRADGSEFPAELSTSVLKDASGKLIGHITVSRDITEREQAEDILRMHERDLAEAQELAHVGNWRWEIIPDEVYWSDEAYRLFGVEPGEAVDYAKYLSIVLPEDRDFIMKEVQDALDGIKPYENEHRIVRNGEIRIHHTKGTVTQDEQGKPIRLFGVVQDITEREQAEEREKELQRELYLSSRLAAIGELAAGVAHQINNPLTGVLGFSQRLLRKSTDQETNQDLKRIYTEAERAAKVVQNLLTFARRRQTQKQYSDINEILESALELRAYELNTSNIEVVTNLAPSLPEIMLDFHQIEEVFLNIILNAEQAMTEANSGGKLTIKTEERKGYIRTTFTDNGPGIPAENLEKIFDPFFSTKGEKGGTGLGLSVCHGIISEHGGRIYAKNKPGKGATFFIELPLPEH